MITGIILVVLSWLVFLAVISLLGYPLAFFLNGGQRSTTTLRGSLWIGLLAAIITILILGIFFPLRSATALAIFAVLVVIAVSFTLLIYRKHPRSHSFSLELSKSYWLLTAALTLALVYLAVAALGPVTNYDSGLYHLGAIKYAGDYSTIPGLTNLFPPFGYNTSLYPIGAFLGNGPWSGNGFRLANGFLILLLVIDLALRLTKGKEQGSRLSTGTYFLLIATPLTLVPLVSLSDYWVTSPSSDAAVLVITLISVAYLLDTLTNKKMAVSNASVSFVAAVIAFSLRPTMVVFLIVLTLVLLYRIVRVGSLRSVQLAIPAGLGIALLAAQSTRDYFLSGWLQYPLSLFSFNVPWLALDPVDNRAATLGNARNPADIWGSVDGFAWVGSYISRLPSQWETYFVLGLALITIVLLGIIKLAKLHLPWRTIFLTEVPVIAALITWFFFSPPTFRFGWGPLFSLFFILIAFSLKSLYETAVPSNNLGKLISLKKLLLVPALSFMLIAVVGFNIVFRFQADTVTQSSIWSLGPFAISYKLAPAIQVPTEEIMVESGLTLISPTQSDQCWDNYPLCTPAVLPTISLLDKNLQEGLLP